MSSRLAGDLARFFLRTAPLRIGAVIVALVVVLTIAVLTTAQAFRLDASQEVERALGTASARTDLPDSQILGALASPLSEDDGGDVRISHSFVLDEPAATVLEDAWPTEPFPARLDLTEGSWPESPLDVAVSTTVSEQYPVGSSFGVLDDGPPLTVTGVVRDRFDWNASIVYAAEGTVQAFDSVGDDVAANAGIIVATSLYGDALAPEVLVALQERYLDVGSVNVIDATALGAGEYSASEELWLLALLAPLAALTVAFAVALRFFRRVRTSAVQIGVTPRQVETAALISTSIATGVSVLAGIAIGFGVTFAARPVLEFLRRGELGPVRDPLGVATQLVVLAAATLAAAALLVVVVRRLRRLTIRPLVWQLVLSILLAAVGMFLGQGSVGDVGLVILSAILIGLAVVTLAGVALRAFARTTSRGISPGALAMRRLGEDRGAGIAMQAAAATLVIAFSAAVLTSSAITSLNDRTESLVPQNRIFVSTASSSIDQTPVVESIRDQVGLAAPAQFSYATGGVTLQQGPTLVVDSIESLETILGVDLAADEESLLLENGTLRTKGDLSEVVFDDFAGTTFDLAAQTRDDLDPSWRNVDGFILQSTADQLGLATDTPTAVFIASDDQIEALPAVVEALGFQPDWVMAFDEPDVAVAPIESVIISVAIAAIGGLLIVGYAFQVARSTRPTIASLTAIGMPRRWVEVVVHTQVLTVVVAGCLIAVAASVVGAGVVLAVSSYSFAISPPWPSLLASVLTILAFAATGAFLASRRVRPTERWLT